MKRFEISHPIKGLYGVFAGKTANGALNTMAREWGWDSYAHAKRAFGGELLVVEVSQ